jgi:hypothetical protein
MSVTSGKFITENASPCVQEEVDEQSIKQAQCVSHQIAAKPELAGEQSVQPIAYRLHRFNQGEG